MKQEVWEKRATEAWRLWTEENQIKGLSLMQEEAEEAEVWEWAYWGAVRLSTAFWERGEMDSFFHTFQWCLDFYDLNKRQMNKRDAEELLKQYTWKLDVMDQYAFITMEEINEAFEDFARRCKETGYSLRSYAQGKQKYFQRNGDLVQAKVWHEQGKSFSKDALSSCTVCEEKMNMDFYLMNGEKEKGIAIARKIANGSWSCDHLSKGDASVLLVFDKEHPDRTHLQEELYFGVYRKRKHFLNIVHHLAYAASTDLKKAYSIYNMHVEMVNQTVNNYQQFLWGLAAISLFQKAVATERKEEAKQVRLLKRMVRTQAELLDQRNGTGYFMERMNRELKKKKGLVQDEKKNR